MFINRIYRPFLFILCLVVLTGLACNAATNLIVTPTAPKPAATRIPQPSAAPTTIFESTPEPLPTEFNLPDITAIPEIPGFGLPTDKPLSEWQGIPIMPGAIAGKDDGASYTFTTEASASDVESFYINALEKLGWSRFGDSGGQADVSLLIFMKGSAALTLTAFPQGDLLWVMIIK